MCSNEANIQTNAQANVPVQTIVTTEQVNDKIVTQNMPEKVKKKPGRPPKQRQVTHDEVKGIVDKPTVEDRIVEVYCNYPKLFKKIFSVFKSYSCEWISLYFHPTKIVITGKEHRDHSIIYATLEGNKLNSYYCKESVEQTIRLEEINDISHSVDKDHSGITLFLKNNFRSRFYMIMHDSVYENDDIYTFETCKNNANLHSEMHDDKDYPIKFMMESKHFKRKISTISAISKVFSIQKKASEKTIEFTYDQSDRKVDLQSIYKQPTKIQLQTITKDPKDIFKVSLYVDDIKPIANTTVADRVYVAVDKFKRISFTIYLDKNSDDKKEDTKAANEQIDSICTIKIYTVIKDYMKKDHTKNQQSLILSNLKGPAEIPYQALPQEVKQDEIATTETSQARQDSSGNIYMSMGLDDETNDSFITECDSLYIPTPKQATNAIDFMNMIRRCRANKLADDSNDSSDNI